MKSIREDFFKFLYSSLVHKLGPDEILSYNDIVHLSFLKLWERKWNGYDIKYIEDYGYILITPNSSFDIQHFKKSGYDPSLTVIDGSTLMCSSLTGDNYFLNSNVRTDSIESSTFDNCKVDTFEEIINSKFVDSIVKIHGEISSCVFNKSNIQARTIPSNFEFNNVLIDSQYSDLISSKVQKLENFNAVNKICRSNYLFLDECTKIYGAFVCTFMSRYYCDNRQKFIGFMIEDDFKKYTDIKNDYLKFDKKEFKKYKNDILYHNIIKFINSNTRSWRNLWKS